MAVKRDRSDPSVFACNLCNEMMWKDDSATAMCAAALAFDTTRPFNHDEPLRCPGAPIPRRAGRSHRTGAHMGSVYPRRPGQANHVDGSRHLQDRACCIHRRLSRTRPQRGPGACTTTSFLPASARRRITPTHASSMPGPSCVRDLTTAAATAARQGSLRTGRGLRRRSSGGSGASQTKEKEKKKLVALQHHDRGRRPPIHRGDGRHRHGAHRVHRRQLDPAACRQHQLVHPRLQQRALRSAVVQRRAVGRGRGGVLRLGKLLGGDVFAR